MPVEHPFSTKPNIDPSLFYRVAQKGVAAFKQIAVEAYTESGVVKDASTPPMEVLATEAHVTYHIALPGIKKADIGVHADGNCLEVTAKRHSPFDNGASVSGEIAYGDIKRTIDMGNLFLHSEDQISSSYDDGMLVLQVARKPSGKISVAI